MSEENGKPHRLPRRIRPSTARKKACEPQKNGVGGSALAPQDHAHQTREQIALIDKAVKRWNCGEHIRKGAADRLWQISEGQHAEEDPTIAIRAIATIATLDALNLKDEQGATEVNVENAVIVQYVDRPAVRRIGAG